MTWKASDPQGNESAKIRWELVKYTRGQGLDVGCGASKPFNHFIGVDSGKDIVLYGQQFKPDVWISDASKLDVFSDESMDFVYSSHLLEHIEESDVQKTLTEWWRVLKQDKYLILYLPDEDEYPKVGEKGANPDHKWNVSYDRILKYMGGFSWDLVDFQKRNQGTEYSLFFVFKKLKEGKSYTFKNPKPEKTCGVVRYGAIGDLMQAASVFAGLKKQGYHITLYTSPPAHEIVLHDPHIDEIYLQDKDQVPNPNLGEFWAYHKKKYDKWVNLSESVEGTLLALPGRIQHSWTPAARHALLNKNYLEFQHEIAGVPHEPNICFYATPEELEWARKEREKLNQFVLVWSLAGSSVHKTWDGLDPTLASLLLDFPNNLDIVLIGGPECVILEQGWEKEPRVHCKSGKWSLRQSLAFLPQSDMVIGPETGMLNAMSCYPMPKVVFLSHSTVENLTRDWVNTTSIYSTKTSCPGRGDNEAPACHQLHYNWDHCKRTDRGIAQCQADIDGVYAYRMISRSLKEIMRKRA